MIRRFTRTTLALSMAAGGLLLVGPHATAAEPAVTEPTTFGLNASGFATHISGGGVPAGSGSTAFQVIGCTNQAGLSKINSQATIDLGGLGTVSAAKTHVWTTSRSGTVSSWSKNTIADADFFDTGYGSLNLHGIVSKSRAFHDGSGFHAKTTATLGSITLTVLGVPTNFPVPPRGETLTIPGVATITVGVGTRSHTAHGAQAAVSSVTVELIPTSTKVVLGHTHAQIHAGIQSALFDGSSYGVRLTAAEGVARVGQTPRLVMPCQGTHGRTVNRDVADVDLSALGTVHGLSASQSSEQTPSSADAWERGKAARTTLDAGNLIITGVVGRAHASLATSGPVQKDAKGTTLARVVFNGQELQFPAQGALVIAGVASLTPKLVHRTHNGISVTALQITLLDGSGAKINLGHAQVNIIPSGL